MELLQCLNPIIEAIRQNEVDPLEKGRCDERWKLDPLGQSATPVVWDPTKGKGPIVEGVGESEAPAPKALENMKLGGNDMRVNNPGLRRQQPVDRHSRILLFETMLQSGIRPWDLTHIRGDQQLEEVSSQKLEGSNEQEYLTREQIYEILLTKNERSRFGEDREEEISRPWAMKL